MSWTYEDNSNFSDDDMLAEIKAATIEARRLDAQAIGLFRMVTSIKEEYAIKVLKRAGVSLGVRCIIPTSAGDVEVEYVGIKNGLIEVRHAGAKGRLHKRITCYKHVAAKHFRRKYKGTP